MNYIYSTRFILSISYKTFFRPEDRSVRGITSSLSIVVISRQIMLRKAEAASASISRFMKWRLFAKINYGRFLPKCQRHSAIV